MAIAAGAPDMTWLYLLEPPTWPGYSCWSPRHDLAIAVGAPDMAIAVGAPDMVIAVGAPDMAIAVGAPDMAWL